MVEQAQILHGDDEHDISRDTCKMIGRWHAKLLLMASLFQRHPSPHVLLGCCRVNGCILITFQGWFWNLTCHGE